MVRFTSNDLVVGRVINEDSDYMLIEVLKDDTKSFSLDAETENNRFYTLAFMRMVDGNMEIWKPWQS